MFNYTVEHDEMEYRIKWTILKHAQYILNDLDLTFDDLSGSSVFLPNTNVFDVIANTYSPVPAIGCDYQGAVQDPTIIGQHIDIYELRYRGRIVTMAPMSRFGVKSENRNLMLIHGAIKENFMRLSKENRLEIYSFDDEGREPVDTGHRFHMTLLESTFAETNDASRANGVNWLFRVTLDI